jgi:hypothetical protein
VLTYNETVFVEIDGCSNLLDVLGTQTCFRELLKNLNKWLVAKFIRNINMICAILKICFLWDNFGHFFVSVNKTEFYARVLLEISD